MIQIDSLTRDQIDDLHSLYQQEWWTRGRSLDDLLCMLGNTPLIVAFADDETGRLLAFARVLTDFVYKGLILDVIVAADQRGTGLGRKLMEAVINHPHLKAVQHLELYCRPELLPFYQQWGFTAELGELHFMRRRS